MLCPMLKDRSSRGENSRRYQVDPGQDDAIVDLKRWLIALDEPAANLCTAIAWVRHHGAGRAGWSGREHARQPDDEHADRPAGDAISRLLAGLEPDRQSLFVIGGRDVRSSGRARMLGEEPAWGRVGATVRDRRRDLGRRMRQGSV